MFDILVVWSFLDLLGDIAQDRKRSETSQQQLQLKELRQLYFSRISLLILELTAQVFVLCDVSLL